MDGTDIRLVVTCLVLLVVVVFVLFPVRLHKYVVLNYSTVTPFALVILLASTCITFQDVRYGLLGAPDSTLMPIAVVTLFFSLAYICISLDATGVFESFAHRAVSRFARTRSRLFFATFILACILTVLTSNDIVILTLSPIVLYACKFAEVDPKPFLFALYFAANLPSMSIVIGNATNIIVAQQFDIGFVTYAVNMVAPALASTVFCFIALRFLFRKPLSSNDELPVVKADIKVADPFGALWNTLALVTCVALLASPSGLPIWVIGLICMGAVFLCDLLRDAKALYDRRVLNVKPDAEVVDVEVAECERSETEVQPIPEQREVKTAAGIWDAMPVNEHEEPDTGSSFCELKTGLEHEAAADQVGAPALPIRPQLVLPVIFPKLPWPVIPFILSMFIFVEALDSLGGIAYFAQALHALQVSNSKASAVYLFGLLAMLSCNVLTNQPMTILFSRTLTAVQFVSPGVENSAVYSLALASNAGSNLTLVGALAGLLWVNVCKGHGVHVSFFEFAKVGAVVTPLVWALGSTVLFLEMKPWTGN